MRNRVSNADLTEAQKAVIQAGADLASAGKLNDAQADKFIDYVVDETKLGQFARVVRFRNENLDIDKIGVAGRVAVPKSEAKDPGIRRGVTHSKVTLTPKTIMVPWEISDEYLEHNIEGDDASDHLMRMFARRTGNNVEELHLAGKASPSPVVLQDEIVPGGSSTLYVPDTFLGLLDGMLEQAAAGAVFDAAGAGISARVFSALINELPNKFKRNRSDLVFFCSTQLEQLWRERMSTRATGGGDQALNSAEPLRPFGIPLIDLPLLDHNPLKAEAVTFAGALATASLAYAPIVAGSVNVVLEADLDGVDAPVAAYVEDTDYSVDYVNGTITDITIGGSVPLRVTYRVYPQIILTQRSNLIAAVGRDIRIESDRDIFRGVDQHALTLKTDFKFEEITAVAIAQNVGNSL
jgi:hypothetical protein